MVLSMKIISCSFDVEKGVIAEFPDILQYGGYVLCPASIIFGPFMMYKDYCQILQGRPVVSFLVFLNGLNLYTTGTAFAVTTLGFSIDAGLFNNQYGRLLMINESNNICTNEFLSDSFLPKSKNQEKWCDSCERFLMIMINWISQKKKYVFIY